MRRSLRLHPCARMAAGALCALAVLGAVGYGATRAAFGAPGPERAERSARTARLRPGCVVSVRPSRDRRAVVVAPCPRRPGDEEESRPRVSIRFAPRVVP